VQRSRRHQRARPRAPDLHRADRRALRSGRAGQHGAAAAGDLRAGWICGAAEDYDREYCVDFAQPAAFLRETQPEVCDALDLGQDGPTRRKFLARLQGEISKRGTIDVLRHGLKHGPHHIDLFYGTPSPGNAKACRKAVDPAALDLRPAHPPGPPRSRFALRGVG